MTNKKTKKVWLSRALLFLVCFLLMGISVIEFLEDNNKRIHEKIHQGLIENSKFISNNIESKTEDILSTLEAYSIFVSTFQAMDDPYVLQILREASEQNKFLNMGITDLAGNVIDVSGNGFNTEDRGYFQLALQGKSVVSPVLKSRVDGSKSVVYATPIYKGGALIGVLQSSIATNSFDEYFNTVGIESESNTIITDISGNIISDGTLDIEQEEPFTKKQMEMFKTKKEGYIPYKKGGGA